MLMGRAKMGRFHESDIGIVGYAAPDRSHRQAIERSVPAMQ
jgi:hypothetical protein